MAKSLLRLLLLGTVSALISALPIANAHHGFTPHYYPDQVIRIEGTVKQFKFVNPHSLLVIESLDDAGESVDFVCDLQARSQLIRHGADETLFTVGEHIVVVGFAARRDPYGCEFGTGYFDDGSSFTMRSTDKARSQFADNRPAPQVVGSESSIFGIWYRPGMDGDASGRGPTLGLDSITAEGKVALAAFDPVTDNPVLQCKGASPVRSWGPPGLATSVRQDGNKILIYHETMDITRTVHLDRTEHPDDFQRTDMGHSIGRVDDGVLTIETAKFAAGVLTGSILHSEELTLHERVSIDVDSGKLLIEWTADEPLYYAEPLRGSQLLHSTDKELMRYDCVPHE